MIPTRRALPALAVACGALLAAGTAAVALGPGEAGAPAAEVAAEGLCIDLSPLNLPSVCVGQLLGPSV